MSMTNIVCQSQRRIMYVSTDGASYNTDGVLMSIQNKAFPIPHWPGVVTGRGTSVMTPLLAWSLSDKFGSFNEAVADAAAVLPDIVEDFNLTGHHCETDSCRLVSASKCDGILRHKNDGRRTP
jgi:hypothetical protein